MLGFGGASPRSPGAPLKSVLVVEADGARTAALERLLQDAGLGVTSVAEGDRALAKARLGRPDLFVVGGSLLGMSGFSLCNRIRRTTGLAHVPVLLLVGREEAASLEVHRSGKTAATEYLQAEVGPSEIVLRIKALLGLAPPPESLPDPGEQTGVEGLGLVDRFGGGASAQSEVPREELEAALRRIEGLDQELAEERERGAKLYEEALSAKIARGELEAVAEVARDGAAELERDLEAARSGGLALGQELREARARVDELERLLAKGEGQRSELQGELEALQDASAQWHGTVATLEERLVELGTSRAGQGDEAAGLRVELGRARAERERLQDEMAGEIADLVQRLHEKEREAAGLRVRQADLATEVKALRVRAAAAPPPSPDGQLARLQEELEAQRAENAFLEAELDRQRAGDDSPEETIVITMPGG